MESRGRIWTFAIRKVGQFRNSTAKGGGNGCEALGQRGEKSEMAGTERWHHTCLHLVQAVKV